MIKHNKTGQLFSTALGIKKGDVVALTGAGGKTTLMFQLAKEARKRGERVLVATTTRIGIPASNQYTFIDFLGSVFSGDDITQPGIYVNAPICEYYGKAGPIDPELLRQQQNCFDLILLESDGASSKPLKGWETYEPVISDLTTKTIGVMDIQTVDKNITEELVHRLGLFCKLTNSTINTPVTIAHLQDIIFHENGLFQYAKGEKTVFVNKVETEQNRTHIDLLKAQIDIPLIAGSIKNGILYDHH